MSEPPSAEAGGAPQYRAIIVASDGFSVTQIRIKAFDDEAALSRAKTLVDGHAIDLWDGLRFIKRFEPPTSGTWNLHIFPDG